MSGSETHRGILVGVDRSASSMAAVNWAARDAAMRNVPLTLVHVVAPVVTAVARWPEIPVPQDYFERQDDKARRILEDARRAVVDSTADHGPPFVHSVLIYGPTVSTLVNQSKNADMVVVGCRGEGAVSRVLFGSVSTGLVNYAHCPVAVVHDEAPILLGPSQLPVVVGIDGPPASELATAIAFDEASFRGVDLLAVHAWTDSDISGVLSKEWSALQSWAAEILAERLAGWQERYPDVTVHRRWCLTAQRAISSMNPSPPNSSWSAATAEADSPGSLLGSVSTAVVHAARIPAIVARQR